MTQTPDPHTAPDTSSIDPAKLKDAHGRTGHILQQAGLPFEEDEFDGESARDSEAAHATDDDSSNSSEQDSPSS